MNKNTDDVIQKINVQGDKVRSLKSGGANKVCILVILC